MFIGIGNPIPEIANLPGPSRPGWPSGDKNLIMKWETTTADESIIVMGNRFGFTGPTLAQHYDFNVDWGDGTNEDIILNNTNTPGFSHTYASAGVHTVKIKGKFGGIGMGDNTSGNDATNRAKLKEVTNWGDTGIASWQNAFSYCNNLTISATDAPTLAPGGMINTSWDSMIRGADSLTTLDMSSWPVEMFIISRAYYGFAGADILTSIKFPKGARITGNVLNYLFYESGKDGSGLSVDMQDVKVEASNVNMTQAFYQCPVIEMKMSGWDISGSISSMNYFLSSRDEGLNAANDAIDLSNWTTSGSGTGILTLNSWGLSCKFPEINTSGWAPGVTENCTDMRSMLRNSKVYRWKGLDRIRLDNISYIATGPYNAAFEYAYNMSFGPAGGEYNFASDALPASNTNSLSMKNFFNQCGYTLMSTGTLEQKEAMYAPNMSNWNMSNVTDLTNTFNGAQWRNQLETSNWDLNSVTSMANTFYAFTNIRFNEATEDHIINLTDANLSSSLTSMYGMLRGAAVQGIYLDGINDLSGVTNMSYMFYVTGGSSTSGIAFRLSDTVDLSSLDQWNYNATTALVPEDYSRFLRRCSATNNLTSVVGAINSTYFLGDQIFPAIRSKSMTDYSVADEVTDTNEDFDVLGVQIGDVVCCNYNNAKKYALVTNVTANTLTLSDSIVDSSYRYYNVDQSATAVAKYDLVGTQSWTITDNGALYPV